MNRKPLQKSVRFEVFKRDKFTCQYCGRKAPDVVLEVDHIKPVAKGGSDEILNLVTSCRDCNRGKTDKELNDQSAVMLKRNQMEAMQERREQLEMMLEWDKELSEELEIETDAIGILIDRLTDWELSDRGRMNVMKLLKRFGYKEVCISTQIAFMTYYNGSERSWSVAFDKIGGICYNRMKARQNNAEQDH